MATLAEDVYATLKMTLWPLFDKTLRLYSHCDSNLRPHQDIYRLNVLITFSTLWRYFKAILDLYRVCRNLIHCDMQ